MFSLHYNGPNSYFFVNGTKSIKFKTKVFEDVTYLLLCLGNVSKHFSVDNMKNAGSNGHFYGFSVDYDAIAVDDILDIYKYLMKKYDVWIYLKNVSCNSIFF